jgi:N-acetylglucosaminyl-diphospho-decaprenol L-rhamnosyltransferase
VLEKTDPQRPAAAIDLSIVIVNWNVCELLRRCLHSILDHAVPETKLPGVWRLESPSWPTYRVELLVIDSASSDDSVAMVRHEFPAVRLYASETNVGYTGGNNLGIRESRGRYVLVLNPDTEVLGDALSAMVAYMERHSDVGVLGPQLLWPDGGIQSSRRSFPSLKTAWIESTFLQKRCPDHPVLRRYYLEDTPDDAIGQVDWVLGACLMVRRAVIEQVGGFDDTFFMYSEELDWQKRIKAAGWKIVYYPQARIVHYEGKSSEQVGALTHIRFQRSKVHYFRKYHGSLAAHLVKSWLMFHYVHEWVVEALKWCLGHKRALRRERMGIYWQVLRSGLRDR